MYPTLTAPHAAAKLAELLRRAELAETAETIRLDFIPDRGTPVLARVLAWFGGP